MDKATSFQWAQSGVRMPEVSCFFPAYVTKLGYKNHDDEPGSSVRFCVHDVSMMLSHNQKINNNNYTHVFIYLV